MKAKYQNDVYKWERRYLDLAAEIATWSKDLSTQVGAVIVGEGNAILSTGYNGIPRGVHDGYVDSRRNTERPYKYFWYEHAERNAIFHAARRGINLEGSTLYVTPLYPCADCARAIIQTGIKRVWLPPKDEDEEIKARWGDSQDVANTMFREANIGIYHIPKTGSGNWG